MKQLLSGAVILSFFASSCRFIAGEQVSGSGHVVDHEVTVGSFNSIEVGGSMDVRVSQSATPAVKIHADDNLIQYIDVYTEGNRLVVHQKPGFNLYPSGKVSVDVSAPELKEIDVSGAGSIIGETPFTSNSEMKMHVSGSGDVRMDINAPTITAETSGAGKIVLTGQAKDFKAEIDGAGDVDCYNLATENTSIEVSGAGNAHVNASKRLDVHVSGAGDVRYKGNPSINQEISGAGSIKKVD